MDIVAYVKKNYKTLPKSQFDSDECVIVKEIRNDRFDAGEHSYEGVGINASGEVVWCFSSGCSCFGHVFIEHHHRKSIKFLKAGFNLSSIKPEEVNFEDLAVTFNSWE